MFLACRHCTGGPGSVRRPCGQYRSLVRVLDRGAGPVRPLPETTRLYDDVRAGRLGPPPVPVTAPAAGPALAPAGPDQAAAEATWVAEVVEVAGRLDEAASGRARPNCPPYTRPGGRSAQAAGGGPSPGRPAAARRGSSPYCATKRPGPARSCWASRCATTASNRAAVRAGGRPAADPRCVPAGAAGHAPGPDGRDGRGGWSRRWPWRPTRAGQAALDSARAAADPGATAQALNVLGMLAARAGDGAAAERFLRDGLAQARRQLERGAAVAVLNNLPGCWPKPAGGAEALSVAAEALELGRGARRPAPGGGAAYQPGRRAARGRPAGCRR